jgi:hypothetical protein
LRHRSLSAKFTFITIIIIILIKDIALNKDDVVYHGTWWSLAMSLVFKYYSLAYPYVIKQLLGVSYGPQRSRWAERDIKRTLPLPSALVHISVFVLNLQNHLISIKVSRKSLEIFYFGLSVQRTPQNCDYASYFVSEPWSVFWNTVWVWERRGTKDNICAQEERSKREREKLAWWI